MRAGVDAYLAVLERNPELYRFVVTQRTADGTPARPSSMPPSSASWSPAPPAMIVAAASAGHARSAAARRGATPSSASSAPPATGGWPTAAMTARELAEYLTTSRGPAPASSTRRPA